MATLIKQFSDLQGCKATQVYAQNGLILSSPRPISYQIESRCRSEVTCCLCPVTDPREHPAMPRGMGTHKKCSVGYSFLKFRQRCHCQASSKIFAEEPEALLCMERLNSPLLPPSYTLEKMWKERDLFVPLLVEIPMKKVKEDSLG